MPSNERETADRLHDKLTKRSAGQEVTSAIITGLSLVIEVLAVPATDGLLHGGMIALVVMTVLGLLLRVVGWRTVTLTNDEQKFLEKYYDL
jgi:hypothetical protein